MYATDRQICQTRASSLNASALWGRGHNKTQRSKSKIVSRKCFKNINDDTTSSEVICRFGLPGISQGANVHRRCWRSGKVVCAGAIWYQIFNPVVADWITLVRSTFICFRGDQRWRPKHAISSALNLNTRIKGATENAGQENDGQENDGQKCNTQNALIDH